MKPTEQPTLIIMAAGMGSRYGGLKQVDKITDAGEIILDTIGNCLSEQEVL